MNVLHNPVSPISSHTSLVTQFTLARLQQYQSETAYEWEKVRQALLAGAQVEEGPIHAYLKRDGNRTILVIK